MDLGFGLALALSAFSMGLAGSWHCAVMCGATSAAVQRACSRGGGDGGRGGRGGGVGGGVGVGGGGGGGGVGGGVGGGGGGSVRIGGSGGSSGSGRAWWGFQIGRLLGYAVAGAVVASSVAALGELAQWGPALRPIWALAHSAALGLGLWLLWTGRQPGWLARLGRGGAPGATTAATTATSTVTFTAAGGAAVAGQGAWQPMQGPLAAASAGAVWFAWPCGLLQSALMIAALASGPADGALVMAAFAIGSSAGLGALPLWRFATLARPGAQGRAPVDRTPLLMRAAGAALAAGSAWALGQGVWASVRAFCL